MTTLKSAIAALALLGLGAMASAAALPSVRKDIMANAKSAGVLAGLKKPELSIEYSKSGKTATATLTSLRNFGGVPNPLAKPERLSVADAKFRISSVMEGPAVMPIKQGGQVWQRIDRGIELMQAK